MSFAERQKRMERLEAIWEGLADREVIIALKSINAMDVHWDERIPTACVGFGRNATKPFFKFNPLYFDSLTDDEVAFVIAHETAHMVLQHLTQLKNTDEYKENWKAFNVAADCIINDWLHECNYPQGPWFYGRKYLCEKCGGKGCTPDPACKGEGCLKCRGEGCGLQKGCVGPDCSDKTLSEVFRRIMKKFEEQGIDPKGVPQKIRMKGKGQPGDGQPQSGEGEPGDYEGMGGGMVDEHDEWDNQDSEAIKDWIDKNVPEAFKDGMNNADKSEDGKSSEKTNVEEDPDPRTADTDGYKDSAYGTSEHGAKSDKPQFSTAPGHIVGEGATWDIDHLNKVRANWRCILTEGTSIKEKPELTWRKIPTVLLSNNDNLRLPSDDEIPVLRVLVALDVSGSISEGDKRLFLDCWRGIPRNAFEVRGIVFANRAAEIKIEKGTDTKSFKHDHVGDGTEFSSISDWIKAHNYNPDKIVVITDGGSYWRYAVKNPERWGFVIRSHYYETADGGVDSTRLIGDWGNYNKTHNDWKRAKFFSFQKFAKILGSE